MPLFYHFKNMKLCSYLTKSLLVQHKMSSNKKLNVLLHWLHFQESLAGILEKLSAIKSKHQALCSDLVTVGLAQKDAVDSISINLGNTMDLIQQFHHTTDVEVQRTGYEGHTICSCLAGRINS